MEKMPRLWKLRPALSSDGSMLDCIHKSCLFASNLEHRSQKMQGWLVRNSFNAQTDLHTLEHNLRFKVGVKCSAFKTAIIGGRADVLC
jgi:hypothetical protein